MKIFSFIISLFYLSNTLATVNIGVVLRLTDNYNTFVKSIQEGIEFAYQNKRVPNQIKLFYYDHNGTFQSLRAVADKIEKDKINIIIGAETSSDALLLSRFIGKSQIPFITPTASSHKMIKFNPNTFRVSHDDKNVYKIVDYILKREKISNIEVFHNVSKPNTDYISKSIKTYLSKRKIKFRSKEFLSDSVINKEDLDFLLSNDAKIVSLFAFESDLRKVYEILKNEKKKMIYIGADGWGSNKKVYEKFVLNSENPDLFTGIRLMYWNRGRRDKFFLHIYNNMKKKLNKDIDEFHSIGFDSMQIVLSALERNNYEYSVERFVKALKTNVFTNLLTSKNIKFDEKHAPLKDMNLYKISSEGVNFYGTVSP